MEICRRPESSQPCCRLGAGTNQVRRRTVDCERQSLRDVPGTGAFSDRVPRERDRDIPQIERAGEIVAIGAAPVIATQNQFIPPRIIMQFDVILPGSIDDFPNLSRRNLLKCWVNEKIRIRKLASYV